MSDSSYKKKKGLTDHVIRRFRCHCCHNGIHDNTCRRVTPLKPIGIGISDSTGETLGEHFLKFLTHPCIQSVSEIQYTVSSVPESREIQYTASCVPESRVDSHAVCKVTRVNLNVKCNLTTKGAMKLPDAQE